VARSRQNNVKAKIAKKAVAKTGAKAVAKGGARFIPGVGQVVMVVEGAPVAWEGGKRTGKAYTDTWKGSYQAARDVAQATKEGRYSEAAERAGRGAKEGAVGSAKAQWEFTKGAGRTALAALIAKEAADATYYEDKQKKKKKKKKKKKRMARKNKKMSLQDAQMLVAAAPHAAAGFSEQFRISAATGRETFAHLRKKELKKAAKRGAKGAKDSFTSQIKHAGRAAAVVGGGEQFEKALAQETEKFMTKPRMNPDFTLIKHPPGGARSRPPAKAPMSFNEYAVWRESPSVSIIGMMSEIPQMKRTPLNRLAGSDHPMAWMANYELTYRKELHQLRHGPRAIANPKNPRLDPEEDALISRVYYHLLRHRPEYRSAPERETKKWIRSSVGRFSRKEKPVGQDDHYVFAVLGQGAKKNPVRRNSRRNPRQSDVKLFQKVLAHLRALQWVYTTSHWTSAGPNSYSDHLLLERLYEGLDKPIDALGERMVAYFGPQAVDPVAINGIAQKVLAGVGPARLRLSVLLNLEHSIQTGIKTAWKANQESGDEMSLGIDNYLADLADQRDEAIYLLRQRLRE